MAEGRRKFGVAKLSDVLQVSVRLEQARYNLVQAEGSLQKSLSELSSLIGEPVTDAGQLQGVLTFELSLPDEKRLEEALFRRPEILQAELAVKRAESTEGIATGDSFPVFRKPELFQNDDTIAISIPPFIETLMRIARRPCWLRGTSSSWGSSTGERPPRLTP